MSQNSTKEERRFQCPTCGNRYTRRSALVDHIRKHTGEQPYQCYKCAKTFSSKDCLRSHETIHSSTKTHECGLCEAKFHRSCTLRRHERKVHRKVITDNVTDRANNEIACSTTLLAEESSPIIRQPEYHSSHSSAAAQPADQLPVDDLSSEERAVYTDPTEDETREALLTESWFQIFEKRQYSSTYLKTAWFLAAYHGNVTALERIKFKANIDLEMKNSGGLTALEISLRQNHPEILSALIFMGARMDGFMSSGDVPLSFSVKLNRLKCTKELLRHGSNVNEVILMDCVQGQRGIGVFEELLRKSSLGTITAKTNTEFSVFHYAASIGDPSYLYSTVAFGANLDMIDDDGRTLLHFASAIGCPNAISLILSRCKPLIHARSFFRRTALHDLCENCCYGSAERMKDFIESIQLLATGGADLDATDHLGLTPIMFLLKPNIFTTESHPSFSLLSLIGDTTHTDRKYHIILELLDLGADVNSINIFRETALDLALERKKVAEASNSFSSSKRKIDSIIELLLGKGAKRGSSLKER